MEKQTKKKAAGWIKSAAAVLFWILLWQVLVLWLDYKSDMPAGNILVASPLETIKMLGVLVRTTEFWSAVGYSFVKIAGGFFLALLAGVLCAVLASVSGVIKALLNPILRLIKAVPVASFIILALFWLSSSNNLSILISFLMVLPVIYTNVLQGIQSTEKELLEMATVFRIPMGKRIRYIYIPAVMPYFVSACSVGLGFCFKSGIAAEIIGLPDGSIGERLYDAKLYLLTEELFAWTVVIVLVSVLFEKAVMLLVKAVARGLAGKQVTAPEREAVEADEAGENRTAEKGQEPVAEYAEPETGAAGAKTEEVKGSNHRTVAEAKGQDAYGLYEVTKSFENKTVLEQFSLSIGDGETVALMGPSGCGKSTAGKLLLGLLQEDAGGVKRPKQLGAVFQEDRLCNGFDAETNIAMVTGDKKEALEALAGVGLAELQGKPVEALSGGMKRRVAIVRALLSDAKLLVLDEPFTGLDEESRKQVIGFVKQKKNGRSILLITHNEEAAAALADRTISMEMR